MCGEKQFLIITGLGFHLTHMKLKNKPLFELNRILSDKTSGSTDLVIKLNKWVRKYGKNLQLIYDMIKKVSRELKSFTVVDSYLKRLKRIISRNDSNAIKNFSINFEESFREIYHRLYLNARKEIGNVDTILTISNSRTLKEVFYIME